MHSFEDQKFIVEESFELSENQVRQAFQNAGLPFDGQRYGVQKGAYVIHSQGGSGTEPSKIIITIKISDGKLVITIRW